MAASAAEIAPSHFPSRMFFKFRLEGLNWKSLRTVSRIGGAGRRGGGGVDGLGLAGPYFAAWGSDVTHTVGKEQVAKSDLECSRR
jgi:hypothetical protein